MHDVGPDQQKLERFLVAVDTAGGGQRQPGAAVQDGQPADAQQRLFGLRQMQPVDHAQRLQVDVRLIEAVEQGDALRTGELELFDEMRQRGKKRRQLHDDGKAHHAAQLVQQAEIARLHGRARLQHLGCDVIDVELQRIGAGLLQCAPEFHPARQGDAVEARHHRDVQPRFQAVQVFEVALQPALEFAMARQEAVGFGMTEIGVQQEAVEHRVLRLQLLLEQRIHHQRGSAGILQLQRSVEVARQRRSRGHQRVLQLEAEVVGREVDHVRLPVWVRRHGAVPCPDRP